MKRMTQKHRRGVALHPPYTIAQALERLAAFEGYTGGPSPPSGSGKKIWQMRAAGKEKPLPSISFWPGGSHLFRLDRIHLYAGLDREP